ncbi:MAG: hypothetical protein JST21_09300 [Bacteroidetes bacterium]|nr:hypothetical protein [Bacteroidota bacterium]
MCLFFATCQKTDFVVKKIPLKLNSIDAFMAQNILEDIIFLKNFGAK